MKSHININNVFQSAKSRILTVLIATIFPSISPMALAAEGTTWSLDTTTSSAQLFQGSRANPESVNSGVARVTGDVKIDTSDLDNSVVDLNIYPADENWGQALESDGSLPAAFIPDATEHTLLTFKSTRVVRTTYGQLKVIGDLTLTRVERSVTMDANDGYAGPVYGDPVVLSETREVTFLFPNSSALVPAALTSVSFQSQNSLDLSGSARVIHEDFPQLLGAINATNWPNVIKDERCQNPSTVGEDYEGATCTGTVIAATQNYNCQILTTGGAEGYTGPVCTPPAGEQTTIALDLKMVRTSADVSTATTGGYSSSAILAGRSAVR